AVECACQQLRERPWSERTASSTEPKPRRWGICTPLRSGCLPRSSDFSSGSAFRHASLRRWFLLSIGGKFKGYVPNVLGILADGPVGGEPRHSRDVEHARAHPIKGRQPQLFDASLRCAIGIEIGCDHVVIGSP